MDEQREDAPEEKDESTIFNYIDQFTANSVSVFFFVVTR